MIRKFLVILVRILSKYVVLSALAALPIVGGVWLAFMPRGAAGMTQFLTGWAIGTVTIMLVAGDTLEKIGNGEIRALKKEAREKLPPAK